MEILKGHESKPPEVMVAQDNRSFEGRVLSTAARAVLEIGKEAPVKEIVALLEASKGFAPGNSMVLVCDCSWMALPSRQAD